MRKYETISVLKHVKKILEKEKGDMDWSSFLLSLLEENKRLKRLVSFMRLVEIISKEDLEKIKRESEEFRRNFRIGDQL